MSSVKQKHVLSLLQTNMTTIAVVFNRSDEAYTKAPEAPKRRAQQSQPAWAQAPQQVYGQPMPAPVAEAKQYTFKVSLDDNVKEGDSVVVETEYGLRVAYVTDVHASPRIDTDADFEYRWVVQVVDMSRYNRRKEEEDTFQDTLQAVERERVREETVKTMSAHLAEGSKAKAMFDAALARVSGAVQIENAAPAPAAAPATGTVEGMQCR